MSLVIGNSLLFKQFRPRIRLTFVRPAELAFKGDDFLLRCRHHLDYADEDMKTNQINFFLVIITIAAIVTIAAIAVIAEG